MKLKKIILITYVINIYLKCPLKIYRSVYQMPDTPDSKASKRTYYNYSLKYNFHSLQCDRRVFDSNLIFLRPKFSYQF